MDAEADSDLKRDMENIELACHNIETEFRVAESEAFLLSLRQSPRPYKTYHFTLERSQRANARLEAARAIGHAAIREWGSFDADYRRILVNFCLQFIMTHAKLPVDDVLEEVVCVAARLLKRGWLDSTDADKGIFFSKVEKAVAGTDGLDKQFVGIRFLKSLVSEFSPTASNALGLSREFHEQCRGSLVQTLQTLYVWLKRAAFNSSKRIIGTEYEIPETKVCSAALDLMAEILKLCECIEEQLGSKDRAILISNGEVEQILNFYNALRQKFPREVYSTDCPLAVSARKLILQFYSLAGVIFSLDSEPMQKQHLPKLLEGIVDWIEPPSTVSEAIKSGKMESELLDGCRALKSIATVTSPVVFDNLLRFLRRPYGTLSLLASVMYEVIRYFVEAHSEDDTCPGVARDLILDSWTVLLMKLDACGNKHSLPAGGIIAANLFTFIVHIELKAAFGSAFNTMGKYANFQAAVAALDKRLSSYALIARATIGNTLPMLTKHISACIKNLTEAVDISVHIEEFYCLLLITGHVLADEGQGEPPLVPKEMNSHSDNALKLSSQIIHFARDNLSVQKRNFYSSARLWEAIVWFLARWSLTYMLPHDESGEHEAALDAIIQISLSILLLYPGYKDLQDLTCCQLLHELVKQRSIISRLVALDSWSDLKSAFINKGEMLSLSGSHQRSLAQTLTMSASGKNTSAASNEFIRDLTKHMTTMLRTLSRANPFLTTSQKASNVVNVSCLLERLRGVARASEPESREPFVGFGVIFKMGFSLMGSISNTFEIYKDEPVVLYRLLKFFNDWVKGIIIYSNAGFISLNAEETVEFTKSCMLVLQRYSDHNKNSVKPDIYTYKDLRALLQLLLNLVDVSYEPNKAISKAISEVVCSGLHIVTPLMTLKLQTFPKLRDSYLSLLARVSS